MSRNSTALARLVDAIKTKWIVFHKPTSLYWRPNRNGYTSELGAAGLYARKDAVACAHARSPQPHNGLYEDRATSLAEEIAKADEATIFGMLLALTEAEPTEAPDGTWKPNPSIIPPWLIEVPDASGRYAIQDDLQGLFARFDLYNDLPQWFDWQREVFAAIGEGPRPDRSRRRIIDNLRTLRVSLLDRGLTTAADLLDETIVELFEMPTPGASIRVPQRLHDLLVDALHAAERIDCRYDREFRELRVLLEGEPLPSDRADAMRLLLGDLRDYVASSASVEREMMQEYAPDEEPAAPALLARIDEAIGGTTPTNPLQASFNEVMAERDALRDLVAAACEKMHCGGASLLSSIDLLWDGIRKRDRARAQRESVAYFTYADAEGKALHRAIEIAQAGRVAVLNLDGTDRVIVAPLDYGLPTLGDPHKELPTEDRTQVPYGYEIWDFYGPDPEEGYEGTLDDDGKPLSCWLWRGVGMPADDGGVGDDTTREQAIAQCWAHRDGIIADARRREPDVLARMVARCIDELRGVVGHDVSALAIESRCRSVIEAMEHVGWRLQHRARSDVFARLDEALTKAKGQLRCKHTWKTVHGSQGHDIHCYNEICTKCDTFRMCSVESCDKESNDRGYCAEHFRLVPDEAEWFIAQGDAKLEIRSDKGLVAVVENVEFARRIIADHNASCARIAISNPASGEQVQGVASGPSASGVDAHVPAPAAGAEAGSTYDADATRVASLIGLAADNGLIDNHNAREVDAALGRLLPRSFLWDFKAQTARRSPSELRHGQDSATHVSADAHIECVTGHARQHVGPLEADAALQQRCSHGLHAPTESDVVPVETVEAVLAEFGYETFAPAQTMRGIIEHLNTLLDPSDDTEANAATNDGAAVPVDLEEFKVRKISERLLTRLRSLPRDEATMALLMTMEMLGEDTRALVNDAGSHDPKDVAIRIAERIVEDERSGSKEDGDGD